MTQIIDKFIEGSLTSNQIHFTNHYQKRTMERELDYSYVKNLIINEEPLDLYEADTKNNFKIIYPSETSGYEIVVVIAAKQDHILVMTVYEKKIR